MDDYVNLTDNKLLLRVAEGDRDAEEQLALRYTRLVKICARRFFLVGGDSEDLIQEGMFGLLSAIRDFDFSMNATFKTYAELCIKRRIYSAIKTATRKKHEPLNEMVSFEDVLSDEIKPNAVSSYEVFRRVPEEKVLARESADDVFNTWSKFLSPYETKILRYYLNGLTYTEIANECGKTEKSVDNAVQRIRRKLAQNLKLSDISES